MSYHIEELQACRRMLLERDAEVVKLRKCISELEKNQLIVRPPEEKPEKEGQYLIGCPGNFFDVDYWDGNVWATYGEGMTGWSVIPGGK